jgi:mevalonate kinase
LPINADNSQVVFDLKALNVSPGDYRVSFVGGGVIKYRHRPELVSSAETSSKKMLVQVKELEAEVKKVASEAQTAPTAKKEQMTKALATVNAKMKAASDALNATQQQLNKAREAAQPRDIADIVVCEPFTIRVKPVEKK